MGNVIGQGFGAAPSEAQADTIDSNNALVNAIAGPRRVTGDAGSVEQYSIAELIAADRYLLAKAAAKSRRLGVYYRKAVPPGTVGRRSGELGGGYGNNNGGWMSNGGYPG